MNVCPHCGGGKTAYLVTREQKKGRGPGTQSFLPGHTPVP